MTVKDTYNELCKAIFYFFIGAFLAPVLTAHFCSPGSGNHPLATAEPDPIITKTFRVTAYCPCEKCCPGTSDGITANGHRIQLGDRLVAAPKEYPFGTRMLVPGYANNNVVLVQDRGGAIKGDKLDVLFPTHQEAIEWGVKTIEVKVYPK